MDVLIWAYNQSEESVYVIPTFPALRSLRLNGLLEKNPTNEYEYRITEKGIKLIEEFNLRATSRPKRSHVGRPTIEERNA